VDGRLVGPGKLELTLHADTCLALVIGTAPLPVGTAEQLLDRLRQIASRQEERLATVRLPRTHPERALDALRVLDALTIGDGVLASATTSLPEAVPGDRCFDYRYCWLRDAALSVSVASLLGADDSARSFLTFAQRQLGDDPLAAPPVATIGGGPVPEEREVPGVAGWGGNGPVRVGNAAGSQVQYDALGLLVEAVSVHLQLGASLNPACWGVVCAVADSLVDPDERRTSGIWELRTPRQLVSGDIGRWLALDRAIWIARGWRPWSRRRHWKRARDQVRQRVLDALDDEGGLPQSYDDRSPKPDASALMVVVFGMLGPRDPRADRLVDATLARLGAWPFVYRYEPGSDDGFEGREGAFLPTSWWAISALAKLGRIEEAESRLEALDRVVPRLMSEEIDPESLQSLGNVPLVWSHMEAVRALYVLDAAQRRHHYGPVGLWTWRIARYLQQRFSGPG
jgi:GH15 family glucan-1,4-alpha-glucosidase